MEPLRPRRPGEALHVAPASSLRLARRAARREGGFALVTGDPGTGKSVTLRLLAERLSGQRDVKVGVLSKPQAGLADFYREMGDLFGVELQPHNRWAGSKILRDRWQTHIDSALPRPVLLIDEAQEMLLPVLAELRLLSSARLDSHVLLTVVLAGDGRIVERFRSDELLPLGTESRFADDNGPCSRGVRAARAALRPFTERQSGSGPPSQCSLAAPSQERKHAFHHQPPHRALLPGVAEGDADPRDSRIFACEMPSARFHENEKP